VKPNTLGAKLGIDAGSRVSTLGEALERCHEIWQRYGDRALIQPYLPGRDVRVSFMDIGTAGPRMGIHAVRTHGRGYPTLDDSRHMVAQRASDSTGLMLESLADTPAGLSIAALARQVERVMGLRDYWSIDLRLAEDGTIWFLEFEVCPAVTIYDFLTYLAEDHGLTLPDAIVLGTAAAYRRRVQAGAAHRLASV
jgi:D-alanine-D-alanine ligase